MLVRLVSTLFDIYLLGLIIFAVSSWADHPTARRIRATLAPFYEPFLSPLRRMLFSMQGGGAAVDFSPLILGILVVLLRGAIVELVARILYG